MEKLRGGLSRERRCFEAGTRSSVESFPEVSFPALRRSIPPTDRDPGFASFWRGFAVR